MALAKFIKADTKNIAVYGGNGLYRPFWRERFELLIKISGIINDAVSECVDKFSIAESLFVRLDVFGNDKVYVRGGVARLGTKFVFVQTL